jgi:amphi-Trp domain-containing protein
MSKKSDKKLARQEAKEARRTEKANRRQQGRKAQAVLSQAQIADQLRALAGQVEAGSLVLGDKEVALPASAEFEISYKVRRKGGHQIEVEIEWGGPKVTTLLPTE